MVKKLIAIIRKLSPKSYWKEILAILIILFAFIFFREQRKELLEIGPMLEQADKTWLIIGVLLTLAYVFSQGMMYRSCFSSLGLKINLSIAVELFLKRNFLSVFLPAGGISSLAYTTSQLRRRNLNKLQIHQASALYGFIGMFTVFMVAVPVVIYSYFKNQSHVSIWQSILLLGVVLVFTFFLYWSFRNKKGIYSLLEARFPTFTAQVDQVFHANLDRRALGFIILFSLLIEACGILHAYIAMYALGLSHSFEAAVVGYTISILLMIVSPFLRGMGAVELSMLYVFTNYGYQKLEGLGITLLYRIFEFWLPLLLGLLAFAWRGQQLLTRIGPAILIFFLGLVNLCSVLTPPLTERLKLERFYVPMDAIYGSKQIVFLLGLGLVIISAYLIKGYRSAYWVAIVFCVLFILGHLGKALDYEEAVITFMVLLLLLFHKRQYRIKSSNKWLRLGFGSFVSVFFAVCSFSIVCFYFIDKHHFGYSFGLRDAFIYTARCFLFYTDTGLDPQTVFAKEFLWICKTLGIFCWLLMIYAIIVPRKYRVSGNEFEERELAQKYLNKFGLSSLDYFKLAKDKELFFSELAAGFTAYRVVKNYAVVLEEPVCEIHHKEELITEFENFCKKQGLIAIYYRIEENSLIYFKEHRKKKLLIGQEAIVDLKLFTLEGKDKKSLRNGLNNLQRNGFECNIQIAPHDDALIAELKKVSDEWLAHYERKEMVFSQGSFCPMALKDHDLILMRDKDQRLVAFLNIIPDYAMEECTYDLIRKTADAPGAAIDGLILKMITYGKEQGYRYLNIGMVALAGLDVTEIPAEKILKFISNKVPNFRFFKSQKEFKEKFTHRWENRYLVFNHDFDLFQLPQVIWRAMKPIKP